MTMQMERQAETEVSTKMMLISVDGHVGPTLMGQLREYCPKSYLEAYDEFANRPRPGWVRELDGYDPPASTWEAIERTVQCKGQNDPVARLADMDAEGIAAEVIFGGGQNGERVPFVGEGLGANPGPGAAEAELRAVGLHIYNQWLADFIKSSEPGRHIGLAHVPIWDVEATIREVEFAREAGLKGVNLPAPRTMWASFNNEVYEPLWAVCEDLNMTLCSHAGGGDDPLGHPGKNGSACLAAEINWLGRRGLWQLIFGGVFERHPNLKMVYTEQRCAWVSLTLKDLDSIWRSPQYGHMRDDVPKPPSEYWASNCFIGGSFLAPHEVALRHEIGMKNLLWGADYPHQEGAWPHTLLSLRHAFAGVPESEIRQILGLNALEVFDLDPVEMRAVADRIGPTPEMIAKPVMESEIPEHRGLAFRTKGDFD